MARPNLYARTSNFTNWQSHNPGVIYNGTDLDTEFNTIATALNQTIANVAQIQRADGALNSQSVGRDQLAASVVQGINTPATWAAATAYGQRDSVIQNNAWYWAKNKHTSVDFAADLAAGNWQLINDFSPTILSVLQATSATNNVTIGTGAKTLVTQSGKSFVAGMYVQAIDANNPANSMSGTVTSYAGTSLVLNIATIAGFGTPAGWNVVIAGAQGQPGASGSGSGNMLNTGASVTGHIPKYTDTSGTALADGYAVGTGANQLVQRDSSGNYPAGDGSALTNLNSALPIGTTIEWDGIALPAGFLWTDGAAVSRSTYGLLLAALTAAATVTISNASPGVITHNAHGRVAGDKVSFETTGGLPAGLSVGANYFVSATGLTTNTYQISASQGGASVNTSSAGSGTQTERFCPHGCGDGSTTFNVPDKRTSISIGKDSFGGGSAAGRVTIGGSGVYANALGSRGGAETVTLTTAQMPVHNHAVNDPGHAHTVGTGDGNSGGSGADGNVSSSFQTGSAVTGITVNNTGGGGPHPNIPPVYVVNKCIRAL
jgi:microcystin-dependent protein